MPDRLAQRLRTPILASRKRQSLIVLALCAAVAAASAWMYVGVERSLRELRAQGLPALLEAKTKSLEVFIAERQTNAERWARDARVATLTAELARRARGGDIAELCRSAQAAEWQTLFVPLVRDDNIAAVNAVDRDGRIIASTLPEACGLQAQPRAIAPQLAQVFGGRTQFIRPYAADARLVAAQPFLGSRPHATRSATSSPRSGSRVTSIAISRASCPRPARVQLARPMRSTKPARCCQMSATYVGCIVPAYCPGASTAPPSASRCAIRASTWTLARCPRTTRPSGR